METTAKFDLTSDQANQLGELIEDCLKELRETEAIMADRQREMDRTRAETEVIIARLQDRAERGWNVEASI
jgi:hypothetical protein